jgi:hypothetical protein
VKLLNEWKYEVLKDVFHNSMYYTRAVYKSTSIKCQCSKVDNAGFWHYMVFSEHGGIENNYSGYHPNVEYIKKFIDDYLKNQGWYFMDDERIASLI